MQDQKTKKNWAKILLVVITIYAFVASGVALYMKFGNTESKTSKNTLQDREIQIPSITTISQVVHSNTDNNQIVNSETENIAKLDDRTLNGQVANGENDSFEQEYAKYLASSLGDVPARTLDDSAKDKNKSEVLIVSSNENSSTKKTYSFFDAIIEGVSSLFSRAGDEESALEEAAMIAEIDGEIGEMQSHFTMMKERNGVTYIDHLNKPHALETNGFYIYIGVAPSGFTFHRTIIRYSGTKEIGLKSILIQTSTSDRASIIEAKKDITYKQTTSAYNEWVDLPPTEENNRLLNAIVSAEQVKVTFMGTAKNVEWVLSVDELVILKESMHFYNLLKQKEELSKK